VIRWTFRILALLLAAYAIGYGAFALTLPGPAGEERTEAIVVLTGGPGRLERGFERMERGLAETMLISGVPRTVRPQDYAAEYHVDPSRFPGRIALGQDSVDTRSNAEEVARWLARRRYRSIRLVTSDVHMRRARYEIGRKIGSGISVVEDAVATSPDLRQSFAEYNKLLLGWAAGLLGL
jgi:uncharacterized SAM-binding protein YcdF (DUF218 family)